jgi:hypothetical protein
MEVFSRESIMLYRFRLHHNNKIESTVNTQPLSFSTRPSTVNSQQSKITDGATGIDITTFLDAFVWRDRFLLNSQVRRGKRSRSFLTKNTFFIPDSSTNTLM